MKKIVFACAGLLMACSVSSCYVNSFNVGKGAQTHETVSAWNHYLIDGLVPVSVTDPNTLAGGAKDYTVTIKQSFINGLLTGITFGIYAPTTTEVIK